MDILELIYQRMWQLQGRIIQIKNYAKIDKEPFNKKGWGVNDIPKIQWDMGECQAAIDSIEKYRRETTKPNRITEH